MMDKKEYVNGQKTYEHVGDHLPTFLKTGK